MLHVISSSRPQLLSLLLSFAFIVCFASAARAQSALDGFDPNADGTVRVVVVQPDGKILIGGDFTSLAPNGGVSVTRNRIARLNHDGTLDVGFNPNANGTINAIALQADGKILAGGAFNGAGGIGGQTRNRVARLDPVTGLADSFDPNANDTVNTIVVQTDGRILVGGAFNGVNSIGGQTRNYIARLDAVTGAADPFDPNANSIVQTIVVQTDGKILAGGAFIGSNSIGGQTRNRIARLDSTTGAADSFDPNANGQVISIAVQADGKILAGGFFGGPNSIGGQTRNGIARLDAITGLADSFDPNASSNVFAIAIQPDGKILVGGGFSGANSVGGQNRNCIARLDPITGLADSFDPKASLQVSSIAIQSDGKVLIGGFFTTLSPNGGSTVTSNRIARLETDGRVDQTLDLSTFDGLLRAIAVQPDGKILIGGNFLSVLGQTRNNIARLNTDGTLDTSFDPNATVQVNSIAVQMDGKILVAGAFTSIGGQTRNRIARLDAVTGLADSWNPNANSSVLSIAVQADGKILVGGNFTNIGGQARNFIARLDGVTGLADSFDPNSYNTVISIAVQADGKILVGGAFSGLNSIGGQTRNRIARLDPSTGLADSFDPNANGTVYSIVVQADGKILVAGDFTNIGGQPRNRIARLDPTTGLADSFNPNANNTVYSIAVQSDGKVLVGGLFNGANSIGGQTRNRIARLDAATGLADAFDPNANNSVLSIALPSDGKVLAAGNFTTIGGQTRTDLARLTNDTLALQNLGVTQTTVTWTRGGSSPQFTRVTFEDSTDGINYNFLGNGTATGSNWTLTGLNLSTQQNLFIRARGYYRSGFFNGSESIQESVRNAFLSPIFTISGTITYGNAIGNPVPPRFVKNVSLSSTAGSPAVGPVITGTPGTYTLTGFGAGSYTIKPTKPGGANGAITSNDAARVAQGVVASPGFVSQNQRFAADVSGNGGVTSNDAALIARFAAGLTGAGNAGQWKFFVTGAPSPLPTPPQTYNDSRTYASVTSSLTGEDYVAILVGEVSGNWNPATHPRPAGKVDSGQWTVDSEDGGPERRIAVELPQAVVDAGKEIIIPVSVEGVTGKDIISYEFNLIYDPAVIQPMQNPVDVTGTISRGLMVVTNPYEPGLLRVVVYGAMPIDENGELLNLKFSAVGAVGSISYLKFENLIFNDGEPPVVLTDGRVQLL